MLTNSNSVPANAIKKLKVHALLERVSQREISEAIKLDRATVSKHLNKTDMYLSEFFGISKAIGIDPIELLTEAQEEITQKTQ
ncbi:hypothetical protein QP104_07455 [Alloscardovia omnicolens]|uniref:hypothetical protein n=1 Tax=Alloscardovia omnicolens TaxID=419015 RepID=UPI00254F1C13|nr:hypothetical protein [Alloscardovia omnicolens]MDK6445749.1 hypothetical protein [Alloscardovia omnicolens]